MGHDSRAQRPTSEFHPNATKEGGVGGRQQPLRADLACRLLHPRHDQLGDLVVVLHRGTRSGGHPPSHDQLMGLDDPLHGLVSGAADLRGPSILTYSATRLSQVHRRDVTPIIGFRRSYRDLLLGSIEDACEVLVHTLQVQHLEEASV